MNFDKRTTTVYDTRKMDGFIFIPTRFYANYRNTLVPYIRPRCYYYYNSSPALSEYRTNTFVLQTVFKEAKKRQEKNRIVRSRRVFGSRHPVVQAEK